MIELKPDKYYLLIEPLKKVTINNLFARSVVEKHVNGKIFVDSIQNPKTFYVIHPYGISLLFGNYNNHKFNSDFREYALNTRNIRTRFEWMQTFPREWDVVISDLLAEKLIKHTENKNGLERGIVEQNSRVNFKFNYELYKQTYKDYKSEEYTIIPTGLEQFRGMSGSVIPLHFWNNANDFISNGMGFTLIDSGKIASTAYSAFVHENKFEIGIETIEQFRGKGYAQKVCTKLIDYCLEKELEPVWSCKLENHASYKLALKLGFEPSLTIPFYRLSN